MLEDALFENKEKQEKLRNNIDSLERGRPVKEEAENPVIARNPVTVFYAPYFKDVNLYTHPPNEDTLLRQEKGELDLYLTNPRELTEPEKNALVAAVREDAICKKLKYLVEEEKNVLMQMRVAGISMQERIELRSRLRKLIAEETDIKNLPDSELFKNATEEYDWMKITAQAFNRTIPETTCRLMWLSCLHPSINRGKWSRQEDRRLKELVDQPDKEGLMRPRKDWDWIASELGTNRTAFLCFHRFQIKFNRTCDNRKWSAQEDARLRELVRQCRINRFVPWTKISYYMHNRTKDQCYQRYVYSIRDDVRQGFFGEVEDHIILVGAKLFGNDWARIAHFIPSRTPMQIHSRFNTFLKANFDNWSQDEDMELLRACQEKGTKDWVAIAGAFQNRTRSQCRQRWYYIHKSYKRCTNSPFSLNSLAYSEVASKPKLYQRELYGKLNTRVDDFLKQYQVKEESDEEKDTGVDLDFSVEKTRTKSYHTTPDGERIPMKTLMEFMRQLRDELPRADGETKKFVKHDVGLISSQVLDKKGNLVSKSARLEKNTTPLSIGHLNENKRLQRLFLPAWPIRYARTKEVYRHEYELKIAREVGRSLMNILSASDLLNVGEQCGRPLIDALRKPNQCKENPVFERQKQFLEIIRAKCENDEAPCSSREVMVQQRPLSVPKKPVVKTYSRKSKQTPYLKPATEEPSKALKEPSSNFLRFVPPSLNTLVAMRGLLLASKTLRKQCTSPEYGLGSFEKTPILQTTFTDPVFLGLERQLPSSSSSSNQELSPQEAEKRLRDRFMSLFFWPSLMATIKPNERRDVFDIVEEDEVVAACNPLDTTEIFAEAQSKASLNPRIVRAQKRKSEAPKRVQQEDDIEEEAEEVQEKIIPEVAPPPIKKRLLVQSMSQK